MSKPTITISEADFRAMAAICREHAKANREDVIGSLMLTGAHWVLSDIEIVDLSKRIEAAKPNVPSDP